MIQELPASRPDWTWRLDPENGPLMLRLTSIDVTPNLHPVAIRASASLLRESAGEARGCVA